MRVVLDSGLRRNDEIGVSYPRPKNRGYAAPPRPLEGRSREARVGGTRCGAPRGLARWPSHSGGAGVPPGPKMRSCQELADDPLAYTKPGPHNVDFRPFGKAGHSGRKRGPVVAKSSPLARREAPAVVPKGSRSHRFALFGAPSPLN